MIQLLLSLSFMKKNTNQIIVTLSKSSADFVRGLAKKDKITESKKAAQLIEMALDDIEDAYWSKEADKIDQKTTKWISHEEFWSKVNG